MLLGVRELVMKLGPWEGELWLSSWASVLSLAVVVWEGRGAFQEGFSLDSSVCEGLYKVFFMLPMVVKETVLGSKGFVDCSWWKMGPYHLVRID